MVKFFITCLIYLITSTSVFSNNLEIKRQKAIDCITAQDYYCAASLFAELNFDKDLESTHWLSFMYMDGQGVDKNWDNVWLCGPAHLYKEEKLVL